MRVSVPVPDEQTAAWFAMVIDRAKLPDNQPNLLFQLVYLCEMMELPITHDNGPVLRTEISRLANQWKVWRRFGPRMSIPNPVYKTVDVPPLKESTLKESPATATVRFHHELTLLKQTKLFPCPDKYSDGSETRANVLDSISISFCRQKVKKKFCFLR
jgi:hypothetical protein